MQRSEYALAAILVVILLAGAAYEFYNGAGKTAEVIITHPGTTPFDAATTQKTQNKSSQSTPTPQAEQKISPPDSHKLLLSFLNSASHSQLMELPGIGKVIAERIIAYRRQHGPFTHTGQVMDVRGIGTAKLEDMILHFHQKTLSQPMPTPFRNLKPSFPQSSGNANLPYSSSKKLIPLNRATKSELMDISGIGPSLANAILEARQKTGGFRSWRDVDAIKGIGERRLKTLQQHFIIP